MVLKRSEGRKHFKKSSGKPGRRDDKGDQKDRKRKSFKKQRGKKFEKSGKDNVDEKLN